MFILTRGVGARALVGLNVRRLSLLFIAYDGPFSVGPAREYPRRI